MAKKYKYLKVYYIVHMIFGLLLQFDGHCDGKMDQKKAQSFEFTQTTLN